MTFDPKKKPLKADTLKAWCHWRRLQLDATPDAPSDEYDHLKAIEDVIAQVNNYKKRYEDLLAAMKKMEGKI